MKIGSLKVSAIRIKSETSSPERKHYQSHDEAVKHRLLHIDCSSPRSIPQLPV